MYIILVYDICQEENGAKRWSHVFKTCKKYLHHIQDSVFEGEITNVQLAQLHQELKQYVDRDLDSVTLIQITTGTMDWIKSSWGKKMI